MTPRPVLLSEVEASILLSNPESIVRANDQDFLAEHVRFPVVSSLVCRFLNGHWSMLNADSLAACIRVRTPRRRR